MPRRASTDIERVKRWNPDWFHEAVVAHITSTGQLDDLTREMRQLGCANFREFFPEERHPVDGQARVQFRPKRSLANAQVETFAGLCQLLALRGAPLPLADLFHGGLPHRTRSEDRIRGLEDAIRRSEVLQLIVGRALHSELSRASESLGMAIRREADAILHGDIGRHTGYVTPEEMLAISKASRHVRIITTRTDLGAKWIDNHPFERHEYFELTRDRLESSRHTFIFPDDASYGGPDPLGKSDVTWKARVEALRGLYVDGGQIAPEWWDSQITCRFTRHPIPASVAIFELAKEGVDRLSQHHAQLVNSMRGDPARQDSQLLFSTGSGTMFIGISYSAATIPHLTTLLTAASVLFACRAFVQYWSDLSPEERTLSDRSDPRVGLPLTKDRVFLPENCG